MTNPESLPALARRKIAEYRADREAVTRFYERLTDADRAFLKLLRIGC